MNANEDVSISANGKLDVNVGKEASLNFDSTVGISAKDNLTVSSKEYMNEADKISVVSDGKLALEGAAVTRVAGKGVEIQGKSNKLELP